MSNNNNKKARRRHGAQLKFSWQESTLEKANWKYEFKRGKGCQNRAKMVNTPMIK